MNNNIPFSLWLVFLGGGLFGCSTSNELPRQYISRPHDPSEATEIVTYSKPDSDTLKKIDVQRVSLTADEIKKLAFLPRDHSTRDGRWLVEERPNTMRGGPWTNRLYVFDKTGTNQCVRIELSDTHARVDHTWLKHNRLFVEVWFGRISWTDFILDTETLRFFHMEDGRDDFVHEELSSSSK